MNDLDFLNKLRDLDSKFTITPSDDGEYHSVKTRFGIYYLVSFTSRDFWECLIKLQAQKYMHYLKSNETNEKT